MSHLLMHHRRRRNGFTLVEMLVAMAVTLLMMAALAKSFNFIGQKVRDSRVEVSLSGRLRDVTHRMKEELANATVQIDPVTRTQQGDGYILYFEGPLSDSSGVLMGESPSAANESTLQDAKIGDFDDYLAFTAKAEGNHVFQGKVPRFLLDAKAADAGGGTYAPSSSPGGVGGALDPVVITSKYAEIIYFASPVYQTEVDQSDPSQRVLVYDASGNPQFIDEDGDLLPDRIQLHRRVLLIRPDLNLDGTGALPTYNPSVYDSSFQNFEYLSADAWASDSSSSNPAIKTPGTHGISVEQQSRAWLMGMGPVHQYCDLSVRRGTNTAGHPTTTVSANSLADLTRPENRFAHVRMPQSAVGIPTASGAAYSSMPLLAMGGAQPLLSRAATNSVSPPMQGSTTASVVTPLTMNGFLRPEFVLGWDHTHTDYFGDGWGIERIGEDVLASNVLGFDVQIYDSHAQLMLSPGADGGYGVAGVDDDLSGTADNVGEAGASDSDDALVGPNDPGYSTVLRATTASGSGSAPSQTPVPALQGDFVDLFYAYQAGGTLRGDGPLARDIHTGTSQPAVSSARLNAYLQSDYSGYRSFRFDSTLPDSGGYIDGLYKSGRLVRYGSGAVAVLQPAYDTYTDHYERDGFLQRDPNKVSTSAGGTTFAGFGTLWWFNGQSIAARPPGTGTAVPTTAVAEAKDWATKGFNDVASLGTVGHETKKPFSANLRALRVRVRLEDPSTQLLEQMSAVVHFAD